MSITLNIAGQNFQIDNLTDLVSQNSASTLLSIADKAISGNLNNPVSQFPQGNNSAQLNYSSGNNSWTAGNFTFGLSGGVVGSVSILQAGQTIVTYTKSFPTTVGVGLGNATNSASTATITVPTGQYYVQVSLDLTLTASVSATVPVGAIGITGSFGTNDTFQVSFSKLVDGSTPLLAALQAAFAGFVLPLHSQTYQKLQPGDYLFHEFNATLNLGFGANYGLNQVLYAGQYKGDINVVQGGPTLNTSVNLQVQAGATLSAGFKYTGSFEALLWKTDAQTSRFHLYKNSVTDKYFNLGATISVIADPTVNVSAGNLQSLAGVVLPGTTGEVVGTLLSGQAQTEVNTWVGDLQSKITSWLQPFQQGKTALQLAIDDTNSSFLLTDFTFNLTQPGFAAAWNEALSGDFIAALAVPNSGVSLDPGSGLEKFHNQKTSVTFSFFGLTAAWTAANIANYSIVYAGNNTFNLIENIGRTSITTVNSGSSEIDFYFAATATSGPNGTALGEVDLHVVLKAVKNKSAGNRIATIVSGTSTGTVPTTLGKQIVSIASQKSSTESLEIIFKPTAYARLSSSTTQNGVPTGNVNADQRNYAAFQAACGLIMGSAPANFQMNPAMDYGLWSIWNIAAINEYPPQNGDQPNRRQSGNLYGGTVQNFASDYWPGWSAWQLTSYAFFAASNFMNLCEDLKKLSALIDAGGTWDALIADLRAIINNDMNTDFVPAWTLALANCMGKTGVPPQIVGPAPTAANEPSIAVTLQYA
jgi:hypothetical protein